jgi:hypothetical protein
MAKWKERKRGGEKQIGKNRNLTVLIMVAAMLTSASRS